MADQEKKALEIPNLEVAELEDSELEEVAGGNNTGCPTINAVAGCGSSSPTLNTFNEK